MPATPRSEGAETARRVLQVLELIGRATDPLALDAIVRQLSLNKSTAYRLVRVLQEEQFIEHADGGGYLSGSRLFALAAASLPNYDTYDLYLPLLQELATEAGETCTLHRRIGDRAVLVLGAESKSHPVRRVWSAGELTPLTRGNAGIAILSTLSDAEIDELLAVDSPREAQTVRREVERARNRGFTLSFGANHPGVHGIGTPAHSGSTPVSVSVSGPADRWTERRMIEFAPRLVEVSRAFFAAVEG
jgi:DNA-binding IclR family transcriptional regulator